MGFIEGVDRGQAALLPPCMDDYPRMQILAVPEIVAGKRFATPSVAKGRAVSQPMLPLG